MTAKIIDLQGLLDLGFKLRSHLRPIAEEPIPLELQDLAAEVDRALRGEVPLDPEEPE